MDPNRLIKEIGAGKFRPVYYFFGDEDFRKVEALKYIVSNYIPGNQRQLQLTKMSAAATDLETIISELAAIPMLGERRVLFVDEIQKLHPTQYKKLFAFLSPPPPETVIILSTPAVHTPKKSSAFYKAVAAAAEPVLFDRLTGNSARARITRHLDTAEFTYDAEAVDLLVSLTDGNFGGLSGELEKLSLSGDAGTHIGIDEVKKLASSYEEFGIFELIDLIAEKQANRALYAYSDLLRKGTSPVGLLVLLSRHVLNLLKAHAGKKLIGHPFFVEKLRKQARNFSGPQLLGAVTAIAAAERNIRRTRLDQTLIVENLIREIAR